MKKLKKISFTAMFAALIFVATYFIHVPVASGYVHFGDSLIYLCAGLLGGPWAALAGAIGEGLADLAGGFGVYAPATVIIKAALGLIFILAPKKKLFTWQSAVLSVVSAAITVGGYFLADLIIDKAYAVVDIPGNIIQGVGSAVIFVVLALALDAVGSRRFKKLFE